MTKPTDDSESAGEMLQRLGIDAEKWALELTAQLKLREFRIDDYLSWCANMLMAGFDEGQRRGEKTGFEHAVRAARACTFDDIGVPGAGAPSAPCYETADEFLRGKK